MQDSSHQENQISQDIFALQDQWSLLHKQTKLHSRRYLTQSYHKTQLGIQVALLDIFTNNLS